MKELLSFGTWKVWSRSKAETFGWARPEERLSRPPEIQTDSHGRRTFHELNKTYFVRLMKVISKIHNLWEDCFNVVVHVIKTTYLRLGIRNKASAMFQSDHLWGLYSDFRGRVSAPLTTWQWISPHPAPGDRPLTLSNENWKYPSCLTFSFMLSFSHRL